MSVVINKSSTEHCRILAMAKYNCSVTIVTHMRMLSKRKVGILRGASTHAFATEMRQWDVGLVLSIRGTGAQNATVAMLASLLS